MKASSQQKSGPRKCIWVDLDNSPHVPFFVPIIAELERRGYSILITARDCFQVCGLADLNHLSYKRIGRHYGKNMVLKMAGLGVRALSLGPSILAGKPDLALSHGSRSQLLLSSVLRIPTLMITDYEFARDWLLVRPSWVMLAAAIPKSAVDLPAERVLKYRGIKEDIYVPQFKPNPAAVADLDLGDNRDIVVTARPPADEAHYYNPESDEIFNATIEFLTQHPALRVVMVPRNERQGKSVRKRWSHLFETGKMTIPNRVVDGLNLIWYSDLVLSGGGTMNREAAALGVPVYSAFRGTIGAVDRYLAKTGRMVLLESVADIQTKVVVERRRRSGALEHANELALADVVNGIVGILDPASLHRTSQREVTSLGH